MFRRFGFDGFGQLQLHRGAQSAAAALGNSVALETAGAGISLSSLNADGTYTLTSTADAENRVVVSSAPLTGDILLEIAPLTNPPNIMFSFRTDKATSTAHFTDPGSKEIVQTEGGGVGPNWLGAWKDGAYQGQLSNRNGNVYMERVGSAWRIYTGPSWAARGVPIYSGTASDTADRYLGAIMVGASASVNLRFLAHP